MAQSAPQHLDPLLVAAASATERAVDDAAVGHVDAVLDAGGSNDAGAMALAWALRCRRHHRRGETAAAEDAAERCRRWLEHADGHGGAWAAMTLHAEEGRALALSGRPDRALGLFADALQLAQELGVRSLCPVYATWLGNARTRTGDLEGALAAYEEALTWFDDDTPAQTRGLALHNLSVLYGELGDNERAVATCREADAAFGGSRLLVLDSLALMLTFVGEHDEALEVAERQVRLALAGGDASDHTRALATRASVLLGAGRVEEGTAAFESALARLDDAPFRVELPIRVSLAELAVERGDGAAALRSLDALQARYGDIVDDRWQPRLDRARARALRALGRHEEAFDALEAAHANEAARTRAEAEERLAQLRVRHELGRERRVAERMARARVQAEERLEHSTLRLHATLVAAQEAERERAELERQLLDAQRMQAVGLMASGIAHDLNNLLTVTLASLDFAELAPPSRLGQELDRARSATHSSAELCRRLLTLTRGRPHASAWLDADGFVAEVATLLDALLPRSVVAEVRLDAAGRHVHADPTHLEQILLNLLVNARDAVAGQGTIELSTSADEVSTSWGWALQRVCLAVRDDGCGMSPEVLARATEALFTTKERSGGTGLGLSTIQVLARRMGGELVLESEPGRGTTVRVLLPAEPVEVGEPLPPGLRVGVVAADVEVRSALVALLAAHGAEVSGVDGEGQLEGVDVVVGVGVEVSGVQIHSLAGWTPRQVVEEVRRGLR